MEMHSGTNESMTFFDCALGLGLGLIPQSVALTPVSVLTVGNEDYFKHVNCEQLGCGYDFRSNNTLDVESNGTYSTHLITERAKGIIENHNKDQPLFLYLPYQAVHFPLQVSVQSVPSL